MPIFQITLEFQNRTKFSFFNDILKAIPKIRDIRIRNLLPEYDWVSQGGRDTNDLGDPDMAVSFYSELFQPFQIRFLPAKLKKVFLLHIS